MRWSAVCLAVVLSWPAACVEAQEAALRRRTVTVNVVEREGKQVWGLTPADFRAEFRGQPVTILSATLDTGPRRVVILVDASGSMARQNKWEVARMMALDIVYYSPAELMPALVVFSDEIFREVAFEQGQEAVAGALKSLAAKPTGLEKGRFQPFGRTAMRDALLHALDLLGAPRPGDALYLITDAGENASHTKGRNLEQELLTAGTRLFSFLCGLGLPGHPEPEFVSGPGTLQDLAEASGGNVLALAHRSLNKEERAVVVARAQQLYDQIARFYLVEIELPKDADEPRRWELEVADARGKKRKHLTVLYPQKLLPCPAEKPHP